MTKVIYKIFFATICLFIVSCSHTALEEQFYSKPWNDRYERILQYPIEDQYRIFRFANDVVEPPDMGMADPIAKQGSLVVPFLLNKLVSEDDEGVRDIVLIFSRMSFFKAYDVKADLNLMNSLFKRINIIKDADWRKISLRVFDRIKE